MKLIVILLLLWNYNKQEDLRIMDTVLLYGDSNAGVIKGRIKNSISDSYIGKTSTNIPMTKYKSESISDVFLFIGTNDLYNIDTIAIKKIHNDLVNKFPKANLYCISGTHGWGTFNKVRLTEEKYINYYKTFERYGFKVIILPYRMAKFKTSSGAHNPNSRYNKEIIKQINRIGTVKQAKRETI